jgi:hypothetical protein
VNGKVNTRDRDGRQDGEIKLMVDESKVVIYEEIKDYQPSKRRPAAEAAPAAAEDATEEVIDETLSDEFGEEAMTATERPEAPPAEAAAPEPLTIRLTNLASTSVLTDIKDVLEGSPGISPVTLFMPGDPPKKIRLPFTVTITDALVARLQQAVREGSVVRS